MKLSPTRQKFRASVAEVQRYSPIPAGVVPAFSSYPGDLPKGLRRPLRDLKIPRPQSSDLTNVAGATDAMAKGESNAVALMECALDAIRRRNAELNAFAFIVPEDQLLSHAASLDHERLEGKVRGPLHGIPITVKDVIHVAGMPTSASSRVLSGLVPTEDALAVGRLRAAGAIILGKTHTHEFALGVTTPQSRNPYDNTRDPGGSSGGSAIAVATGMGLASLGTDTRASIRVPAALCGTVGYKPTYGLVPTNGVVTLSWSLDHVAPMARTVGDIAILLNVLSEDAMQTLERPQAGTDYTRFLNKDVRGLKIGLPIPSMEGAESGVLQSFQHATEALRSLGATVIEIDAITEEDFSHCNSMGLVVSRSEAAAYHRMFNADPNLYTRAVYEQLDEASRITAVDYVHAQRFRAAFQQRMLQLLWEYDALLMPTSPVAAPKSDNSEQYFLVLSRNCIPWSFIGFPAVSLPCGFTTQGLPVGAELVAGPWEDERLLALASALEGALESC